MTHNGNILFIQYPSGGYGFYLTRLINRCISGVVKVQDNFNFDKIGTSHSLPLVYGHVHFNRDRHFDIQSANLIYHDSILQGHYVLVPYCPGINDDMISRTLDFYPKCRIVRLCYDDRTWPLVFYNAITKALNKDINSEVFFDRDRFGSDSDWAKRENFTLLFKSHALRHQWKPVADRRVCNIDIFSLLVDTKKTIETITEFIGQPADAINTPDVLAKHQCFLVANPAATLHLKILKLLDNLTADQDLEWIKELFWQAVVNFYIEEQYDIAIKVNEHPDWFRTTGDLINCVASERQKIHP